MVAAPSMDSMYLDNLEEFVFDEGKIVTYKWLSLTLGVQSNVAKQMLYHFVTNQRNSDKGDNLNVTYFVSGIEAGKDGLLDMHKIMLVREENLASAKSKLKDVISVHVYSVQKTKLPDMSVLYTANYDKVKENVLSISKYSGIECTAAKVRSSADLEKLQKQNAYQAPPEPTKIPSKYKPNQTKTSPKKESQGEKQTSVNKSPGKGNQIASMFARQAKVKEEKQEGTKVAENKSEKDTAKTTPSSGSKKKGGISSFFSKAPPATKKTESSKSSGPSPTDSESPSIKSKVVSPVKTESTVSSPIKTESQDSIKDEESEKMDVDSPPKKKTKKLQSKLKTTKSSQKRGKSKSTEDSEEPIPKRKRIMQLSDSESSCDEEGEGEEENPFPPSPPPEPTRIESDSEEDIPPTPQPESKVDLMRSETRGKRKKLVDKTFMDEDGFIVTKKEYEYVSDSEGEDPLPVKEIISPQKQVTPPKSSKNTSPKKEESKPRVSPIKKKQANIMNFFKKK
ncbi:DNA polymerase delta subunit 3-like [Penaeus chinensis]|uniref:DNA polymerase delta subunit 3-like n=1 Tax=Penaeus chinensis TaxID=139456 RepID=UPI001FB67DE7|nr:DNA polymerase delta subunit 3-like [Penaeus chinensis]